MQLVETITVGAGGAASIEFTGIPQDADDLLCVFALRNGSASSFSSVIRLNSDTSTSSYSQRRLYGSGSGVASDSATTLGFFGATGVASNASTANTFGNGQLYIPNYTGSTTKSVSFETVTENNATEAYQFLVAGLYNQTSAITAVSFTVASGNLAANSTASLYKIKKFS